MAAYSFYNVGRSTPLLQLMRDALITAKNVSPAADGAVTSLVTRCDVTGGTL